MSQQQEEKRTYTCSDGTLIQLADSIISSATRDATELIPEGVTAARLTALGNQNDTFRNMEDDIEWSGLVTINTELKNAALDVCETQTRNIRRMAANVFGVGSGAYGRFGFDDINTLRESDRIRAYYRIVRRANQQLAALTPEGLTPALITTYTAACAAADAAYDVVVDTIKDRDTATGQRIILGNLIYAEVVKIANTGKTYWFDKEEAKYNDYVITPSGTTQGNEDNSMKFNGLVTDSNGNPLAGVTVAASNAEGTVSTTTGVGGLYSLQIVGLFEPIDVTLTASLTGYTPISRPVTAVNGEDQVQNFQLALVP